MTDREMIEKNLADCQKEIDFYTKELDCLKSELLPHLPGYHKPGTVLVVKDKERGSRYQGVLLEKCRVMEQKVGYLHSHWIVFDTFVTEINKDGSDGPQRKLGWLPNYHPEAPGKDEDDE